MDALNEADIRGHIHALNPIIQFDILDTIDSTNRFLKNQPVRENIHICCAETQTQGRGRFGRAWHSPFGENIYFSARFRLDCDLALLSGLSLVTSLAVINTIEELGLNDNLVIKWPNDILWQDRKLSGCLIELIRIGPVITSVSGTKLNISLPRLDLKKAQAYRGPSSIFSDPNGARWCSDLMPETEVITGPILTDANHVDVIIGIGINVNSNTQAHPLPNKPWCSLFDISGEPQNRNRIIGRLVEHLYQDLQRLIESGLTPFLDDWRQVDGLYGQLITVSTPSGKIAGRANGIDDTGKLILVDCENHVHYLSSGETSMSM